ncbi:MAG: methyltransferase [Oscillospiraceae bacterium]|nr:methyltransferase [Oscillospiraceae bacterium]
MSHYFIEDNTLPDDWRHFAYYYNELAFAFTSNAGMFSPGHVDEATDLLIKALPPLRGSLLDLGCGYGVIGIVLGKAFGLELTLADINRRALECARRNCAKNGVRAEIIHSDGFESIPDSYDTITLNPPIHAGKEVVYTMFAQARTHLKPAGAFYVVMLEKHGAKSAQKKLAELFGSCETIYRKKGCYVFSARIS